MTTSADPASATAYLTTNPATQATLEQFEPYTKAQLDAILDTAVAAFSKWRHRAFEERAVYLKCAAAKLRSDKTRFARTITLEMGKPIAEAEAEIEKCAIGCDHYAEQAARYLADEPVKANATESYVSYQPLGVVLAVMPWNFPFWQVFRFAAPALMAGNVGVLKHAANVSRCALEIAEIFRDAGYPPGVFSTVLVPGKEVARLIADPRIAAVTLTGSEDAGASVAAASGHALKKTVLELGGSDAFIVLADADLDAAAATAVKSRFQNTGQSCIAAKRFIVEESVYDAFLEKFVAGARALLAGDPLQRDVQIGPLARADLRDALEAQIRDSEKMGARIALGGKRGAGTGFYFEPTIVADVRPGMPMFDQETFGPAAAVIRAKNVDDAIGLANDSPFGLGGNLWTRDIPRAREIARKLESGGVFINGMTASDPRLPFGGVKRSGYGRELSWFGIREFVNIQTVWIGPPQ